MRAFPSGEQVQIARGDQVAVAVTVGGGLREYRAGGRPVLDGYPADRVCDGGRGQLLVPWPNRLRDGAYQWEGHRLQVALDEPELGNAIHGLARWMPWRLSDRGDTHAVLGLDLPPQPGYPFQLRLSVAYRLDDRGLTVRQTAENIGITACPYGAGAHPYLTAGGGLVDGCRLTVPGGARLLVDERQIPVGVAPVAGTEHDFRRGAQIGVAKLDTAYTDLERDADGRAWAILEGAGHAARIWVDSAHPYLMVFTGDTLAPERRRRGVAIEPMTCAPNAFQRGDGLSVLAPGETFSSEWGIAVSS